jgi:CzcA family heavy metal efflux pump
MTRWIVGSSLRSRFAVIAIAAALLGFGTARLRDIPVEALPDFGPPRVEIQTEALGLSAEEVENLITNPMEQEFFNGMPWLDKIRSDSITGLSSIELIFEPGTDPIRARQVVQERLTMTPALPQVSKPPFVIQPVSTTSRLMIIGLSSKTLSLIDMSVLARWKIAQRLISVPGVANVAIWGLRDRQLQVLADPERLRKNGVALDQVIRTTGNAMWSSPLTFVEASTPGTGGFIDTANQRIEIQHTQPIKTAKELAQVTIEGAGKKSLTLGDVARVVEDHQLLIGDAIVKGHPSLLLVVERFPGTSVADLTREVEAALDAMRPGLAGIDIDTTVFRPATFVETARDHLAWTLIVGFILLALLLGAFLFNWRAALISVTAISMSFATAVLVLSLFGVTFNMMILTGLVMAIAIVVDDAIIDVDNIRRRLRQRRQEREGDDFRLATILAASLEIRGPILVATVIIAASVVPVLAVGGVTGALLRPLALAYLLAIVASMVVALTVTPALSMVLFSGASPGRRESPLARWLGRGYAALLTRLVHRPVWAYVAAGLVVVAGLAVLPQLGGQRLTPALQDHELLVRWEGAPGVSLPEMDRITAAASRELRSLPGVSNVGSHVGRASTSDLVAGVNSGELWVSIDPRADYGRTAAAVRKVVDGYPGLRHEVETYPDQRIREVGAGTDEPLVVRVYGRDYGVLRAKAQEVARIISDIDGVAGPRVKDQAVEPTVEIEVLIPKAARYGIKPGDVRRAAATMLSGITAGNLFEQQKVFDVVVWGTPEKRHSLTSIRDLLIDTPDGRQVRMGDVADVRIRPNPTVIKHDAVSRYIDVTADVQGRSLGSVTGDVERRIQQVTFPLEHHVEVLGEAAQRQSAERRVLSYAIAGVIALFFLLQACFGSWRLASLFFLLLPLALAGAVLAAVSRQDAMSVVSLMGFLTVLAIAARSGILLIRQYQRLEQQEGETFGADLVLRGSQQRFGPTVMSILATALALTPLMIVGITSGLEMVQPLATIILGGLVTVALLDLFILPTIYLRFATGSRPGGPQTKQGVTPDDREAGSSMQTKGRPDAAE